MEQYQCLGGFVMLLTRPICIGRLHARELIGSGPRLLRRGATLTYVTTEQFLIAFDLESLRDLPDREQLEDAGFTAESEKAGI